MRPQVYLPLRKKYVLNFRDFSIPLGHETKIMGIVNVTPDSFSQDGCLTHRIDFTHKAITQAKKLIRQGAHIIDIGGESSRPGARKISAKEEIRRVIPAVKYLAQKTKVPISVDTYKTQVAKIALDAGASIINNIKGISLEKTLLKMIRDYRAAIVLMHMRGVPKTMQKDIFYNDIIKEILDSLRKSIENCLEIGIKSDKIIIDPGIGFGKTFEQNLILLNRLDAFNTLNCPILIGTSRKSFIGSVLNKDVHKRLLGTAATLCASIIKGAHIVRVHDVKDMHDVTLMTDAIINEKMTDLK